MVQLAVAIVLEDDRFVEFECEEEARGYENKHRAGARARVLRLETEKEE